MSELNEVKINPPFCNGCIPIWELFKESVKVYVYGADPPNIDIDIRPSKLLQFEFVTSKVITDKAFGVNKVLNEVD